MSTEQHYYIPESSKWPLVAAITLFVMLFSAAGLIYSTSGNTTSIATASQISFLIGLAGVIYMIFGWFRDVVRESTAHKYDDQVDRSFRIGMIWFIFSEIAFFATFFGSMAYIRFFALDWLASGGVKASNILIWPNFIYQWPLLQAPDETLSVIKDIINPLHLPLINTILLVTSSFTLTIAHKALISSERKKTILWLALTIVLGALFLALQIEEYIFAYTELDLRFDSNVYGSLFFILTGFHGLHVLMGSIILFVLLLRVIKGHFSPRSHFAFEAGAWYWHFVDIVWIGLFLFVYII